MPILATCGSCRQSYHVPDHAAGHAVPCPKCGQTLKPAAGTTSRQVVAHPAPPAPPDAPAAPPAEPATATPPWFGRSVPWLLLAGVVLLFLNLLVGSAGAFRGASGGGGAAGGPWEYRTFVLVFLPSPKLAQGIHDDPGPVGAQLQAIMADGWIPAGFQRDHGRNAWGEWPSSHVLFKRLKR